MPPPAKRKYGTAQNGDRVVSVISDDDGNTWRLDPDDPPDPVYDEDQTFDAVPSRESLGTTPSPGPKVKDVGSPPAADGALPREPSVPAADDSPSSVAQRELDEATRVAHELQASAPPPPPGVGETIARGVGRGAALGWGDDAAGEGAAFADTGLGQGIAHMFGLPGAGASEIPRGVGRGMDAPASDVSSADVESGYQRERNAAAEEAHPYITGASQLVGGAIPAMGVAGLGMGLFPGLTGLGAAGDTAATMARVGLGAAEGGTVGTIEGAGENDQDRLAGAEKGGFVGGLLGGALPAIAATPAGRWVGNKVTEGLEKYASRKRAVSTGIDAGDAERILEQKGSEGLEEFGRDIEKTKLHEDGFIPKDQKGYLVASERAKKKAVEEMASIDEDATFRVELSDIALDLRAEARRLNKLGDPDAKKFATQLEERAEGLFNNQERSYTDALEYRRFLDDIGFQAGEQKNTMAAASVRKISGKVKQAMLDAAEASDEAHAQGAAKFQDPLGPERVPFKQRIEDVNKIYETASKAERASRGAYARQETAPVTTMDVVLPGTRKLVGAANRRGSSSMSRTARTAQKAAERFPDTVSPAAGTLPGNAWFDEEENAR